MGRSTEQVWPINKQELVDLKDSHHPKKARHLGHRLRVRRPGANHLDGLEPRAQPHAHVFGVEIVAVVHGPHHRLSQRIGTDHAQEPRVTEPGRDDGGWFHFMVVAVHRGPDGGPARIAGHWRAGDWVEGAPLVFRTRDGLRAVIVGAEMEPPLNSACEARGQRTLIVPEFAPLESNGCIHAAR